VSTHDAETRRRLLDVAARLFADRGFGRVTVREICRAAHANVASVNYHFGDKLGLYREVLQTAIEAMRATTDAARRAGDGLPPDQKLRCFVQVYLRRIVSDEATTWIHRLMSREALDPTPAFDAIVEQAVQPRLRYLADLVAEMMGCDPGEERVSRCAASINSQWLPYVHALRAKLGAAMPHGVSFELTPKNVDAVATHIADFSIAGVRALAG
jgi:TetR/AcrR family transcriptional regulator, regulator of cefoperazone and chloramphenicol sensitivity